MNAWTGHQIWIAYPDLTLHRSSITTPHLIPLPEDDLPTHQRAWRVLSKYTRRGYFLLLDDCDIPHICGVDYNCPATLRRTDDPLSVDQVSTCTHPAGDPGTSRNALDNSWVCHITTANSAESVRELNDSRVSDFKLRETMVQFGTEFPLLPFDPLWSSGSGQRSDIEDKELPENSLVVAYVTLVIEDELSTESDIYELAADSYRGITIMF
ncbi:hypothetical protein B0H13DRAFT_1895431 [Mycena leptocephala]|nr:hypothetical protein B0H13DRAFT_1895431 [Mycena leptocephala]